MKGHPAQPPYAADMSRALFMDLEYDWEALLDFVAAEKNCSDAQAVEFITKNARSQHVRRTCPAPDVLIPRVQKVQAYYHDVVDQQGIKLFTSGVMRCGKCLTCELKRARPCRSLRDGCCF